jgi:hypothetical protein
MLALMVLLPSAGASQELPAATAPLRSHTPAAQPAGAFRDRWAFGFMSPGFTTDPKNAAIWHIGGGYEWLVARTFALSAGAGVMIAGVEGADWGFPVSTNGSYYFREAPVAQRALVPFISAGYTRGGFSHSSNMFNIGAGFNQWTQGWSGFRFEVRHHISDERGPNGRNWFVDFRLGFVG